MTDKNVDSFETGGVFATGTDKVERDQSTGYSRDSRYSGDGTDMRHPLSFENPASSRLEILPTKPLAINVEVSYFCSGSVKVYYDEMSFHFNSELIF